jgi:hypothetical protein
MLMLLRADLFGTLAAVHETAIAPNAELFDYAFGRRDELSDELARLFGVVVEKDPHGLPPPLTDGCGLPFSGNPSP